MKIRTRRKLKKLIHRCYEFWIVILEVILYPLIVLESKVDDYKTKRVYDIHNYKLSKIKKYMYKELQRKLMGDSIKGSYNSAKGVYEEIGGEYICIVNIPYVDNDKYGYSYLTLDDLFLNSKYKYLNKFNNVKMQFAKEYSIDWWDILISLSSSELNVSWVSDISTLYTSKYDEYEYLYKYQEGVLKVTLLK